MKRNILFLLFAIAFNVLAHGQIDQILGARHSVTRKELQERLGVSWATLKRDIAYMRDRLNAPLIFDRNLGGYRFENPNAGRSCGCGASFGE